MRKLVFWIIFFIASLAKADIQTISSIEEMESVVLESLNKRNPLKTLTIMPLEEVVLIPESRVFRAEGKRFEKTASALIKKLKLSKLGYINEVLLTEYEQRLPEPKIIDFFNNLQKYNAPFMVVTRNLSGSLNKIPYLEVWTWTYLLEKGIDLSKSPIGEKQIIFNKGQKRVKGTYPTFYRGLFSCNSEDGINSPQGLIAKLLTKNLKWVPDIVYVVDMEEGYIKSIEQQFHALRKDIQVFGFVYKPNRQESYDDISVKEFAKVLGELVDKVNVVSREEVDSSKENPYEQ